MRLLPLVLTVPVLLGVKSIPDTHSTAGSLLLFTGVLHMRATLRRGQSKFARDNRAHR
jgi:hypothetical protein